MTNLKPSLPEGMAIRDFLPDDLPFIVSSWSNQIRKVLPWCSWDQLHFASHVSAHVLPHVSKGHVAIVCDRIAPELILSWVSYTRLPKFCILHFGYTKNVHRNRGYFSALYADRLAGLPLYCSHWVPRMERHMARWQYQPDPYV